MNLLSETFEERLGWIQNNWYKVVSTGSVVIRETANDGYAEVEFRLNNEAIFFEAIERNKRFPFLKEGCCADGVFVERKEKGWVLHIIECKRTLNEANWLKIKKQFTGAFLRSHALFGILGIYQLEQVIFYTAYKNDNLRLEETFNPGPLKVGSGQYTTMDWLLKHIEILSMKRCKHIKIKLDDEGKGIVNL